MTNKKESPKRIPKKFQFDPIMAMYVIKHVPTNSIYIGVTTDLKLRMRNHISKLRNGTHPCKVMQDLFDVCPNLDDWNAKILIDGSKEQWTKHELHDYETQVLNKAPTECPELIIMNTYKNESQYHDIIVEIWNKIRILGIAE